MDSLEEKWKGLRLLEDENASIELDEDTTTELIYKEQRTVLGKIFSSRIISKEVLGSTMAKVWKISKAAKFTEVCPNTFAIIFENVADKMRVWEGRPWLFDNQVLVMKEFEGYKPLHSVSFDSECFWIRIHNLPISCMTKVKGEQIGGTVGKVERVDVQEDGSGWGNFLRVQVLLDLTKPVARGRTLTVRGNRFWAPFSYEKLPKICFSCGCMVHGVNGCSGGQGNNEEMEDKWKRESEKKENLETRAGAKEGKNGLGSDEDEGQTRKKEKGREESEGGKDLEEENGDREDEGMMRRGEERWDKQATEEESENMVDKALEETYGQMVEVSSEGKGGIGVEDHPKKKGEWKRRARAKGKQVVSDYPIPPNIMKILSWNCRGLGNPRTVQDLYNMVEKNKPSLVFVMETKSLKKSFDSLRRRLQCEGCFVVEAVGKGGGLVLLWNSDVRAEIVNYSQSHINVWIEEEGEKKWLLTCFYGQPDTNKRKESWSLLNSLKPAANIGWCIVGDFNEILTNDEKWGGRARPEGQMELFREVMNEGNLYDLGWKGDKFTWSNSHGDDTFTKERLDRAVATPEWMNIYRETWVEVMVTSTSDHKPLLLHVLKKKGRNWNSQRAFKYEAS
ncbi:hypothetical protein F2P56_008274 [Juglans regia]|uniref:Uncharacterized protein LOC108995141 n=2 Tax=Juglans regia TaxID=51240 RepID=A0A2I4F3F9_JUGRE|nr:uncharacterized protein LOC108995141 [Juglans regia]KAF5471486.1 hypothetical protein F2P56_008274 [Juglans regia]